MLQAPAKAVYFPAGDDVKAAAMSIRHKAVQCGARFLGAGHTFIDILACNLPATTGGVLTQFRQLHLGMLTVQGADSGVQGNSHVSSARPLDQ
jgi:hypothetical protein